MNDKGNRYALAALKNRRALLAAETIHFQRQIRARKDSLAHVDATLKLLDPRYDAKVIRPKRLVQRIHLFRHGELGRLILGALRDAEKPLSAREITGHVLAAGGHGEAARHAMSQRTRSNLAYLHRRGLVLKSGKGTGARWRLT